MATSRFVKFFQDASGNPVVGASIWLVPQANTYPTGAIQLTPHATKSGVYVGVVPDGEYKVYIDPSGGSSPTLSEDRIWVGESRITSILDALVTDVTDYNASISKHGFMPKLSGNANEFINGVGNWVAGGGSLDPAADYTWTGAHAFNKTLQLGGVLRSDVGSTPLVVDCTLYNVLILNPTVSNALVSLSTPLSTQILIIINRNATYSIRETSTGFSQSPNSLYVYLWDQINSTWSIIAKNISEAQLLLSDVTTGNASTSKHGFLPKLSGDPNTFLNGVGSWAAVSGDSSGVDYFPSTTPFRSYRDVIPQGYSKEKEALPPRPDPATAGLQLAEAEDASQIYNGRVIEVGDFYFLYYAANTQKYQVDLADTETDRKKSDFSRADRIFLAFKPKSEGLVGGSWQKLYDGKKAVIDINTNIYGGGYDVGNAWLRGVIFSKLLNQYVCYYVGDSYYDGSAHSCKHCFATSSDAVNWTKSAANPVTTIIGHDTSYAFGDIVEVGNFLYLFVSSANSNGIRLYRSRDLQTWTEVSTLILPGTSSHVWGAKVIDGMIYVLMSTSVLSSDIKIYTAPAAQIEDSTAYTELGILISRNALMEELDSLNWSTVHKAAANKWVVFYSYYKNRYARPQVVRETNIRQLSFSASIPHPTSSYTPPAVFNAVKSIDEQVVTSTTLQDDDHLIITGLTPGTYAFRLDVLGNQTASSAGIKCTISAPTGTSISGTMTRTTSSETTFVTDPIPSLTLLSSSVSWGGSGNHFLLAQGTLTLTNSGTVKIQWAEQNANGTMTFKANSTLLLAKIA